MGKNNSKNPKKNQAFQNTQLTPQQCKKIKGGDNSNPITDPNNPANIGNVDDIVI